jgi:very-short-patch-repair endonuclease
MEYKRQDYLIEEYSKKGRSTSSIAKEWSTDTKKVYPNTIRRLLKKYQIPLRDKSEAQKNFLADNPHPLQGRARTDEEKRKISEGIQKWWDTLDSAEVSKLKDAMRERAGDKWANMTEKEKAKAIRKMHQASRECAGLGGKNENAVADMLEAEGYGIVQRTNQYTPRNQFEIDMAIPSNRVAVEWDGAGHFRPIFGDKALKRTEEKDKRKNRILVKNGWVVIRCRDHSTAHSVAFCRRSVDSILNLIRKKLKPGVYYIDAK